MVPISTTICKTLNFDLDLIKTWVQGWSQMSWVTFWSIAECISWNALCYWSKGHPVHFVITLVAMPFLYIYLDLWQWPQSKVKDDKMCQTQFISVWPWPLTYSLARIKVTLLPKIKIKGQMVQTWECLQASKERNKQTDATKHIISVLHNDNLETSQHPYGIWLCTSILNQDLHKTRSSVVHDLSVFLYTCISDWG